MSIPLAGQGTPLSDDFPYHGEWLLKPRLFLYLPDDPKRSTINAVQFTASVNPTQEDWSVGFDAVQLAAVLGVSAEQLLEANRDQRLTLENVYADTPTGEDATQKIYEFRLGAATGQMTIEDIGRLPRA